MFGFLRPSLLNPHFALAIAPDERYYSPWRRLTNAAQDLGSSIKDDGNKFQINLDVQQYALEEISVKTVDGFIVVECKHDEKEDDHGFVSRQLVRRYALPEGAAPETVESRLSSDGVISITALRKVPEAVEGERNVPITQTGPTRKKIKNLQKAEKKKEK